MGGGRSWSECMSGKVRSEVMENDPNEGDEVKDGAVGF
jgi:hypothetical protein